ncbi:MAG: hypothetical protein ACRBBQ_15860 [Cognatishimia sp.]
MEVLRTGKDPIAWYIHLPLLGLADDSGFPLGNREEDRESRIIVVVPNLMTSRKGYDLNNFSIDVPNDFEAIGPCMVQALQHIVELRKHYAEIGMDKLLSEISNDKRPEFA